MLAEVERHAEESRLAGYRATLENRDKQNQRDHEFRVKTLNHASIRTGVVIVVAVGGIVAGLYFSVTGKSQLGGYVLVASLMALLQTMSLRIPSSRDRL